MLKTSLLLVAATAAAASAGHAQQRGQSRDDLLDALTRHIQICAELTETQQRLSCYDRLQTQIGGVSPQQPAMTPTPLQAQPQMPQQPPPQATTGTSISSAPLTQQPLTPQPLTPTPLTPTPLAPQPQPLGVPGGGTATLPQSPGGGARDPDAAFDPRTAMAPQPGQAGPRPQTSMRRSGPRAIPNASSAQPLVTLGAANLTYGPTRYWQVTVTLTSNTPRALNTQAECTFMNAGRPVGTDYLGPVMIQPGEQITAELIGPPTTTYVDSSNCKLLSP